MASAARSSSRRKRSEPVSPPIDEDLTAGAWKRTRGTPAAAGDPVTRVVIFDPNDGGQFTELREQDQLIDGVLKVGGERLRIHAAVALAPTATAAPGTLLAASRDGLDIACGDGVLRLLSVQREGGRPLAVADYLNARPALRTA